MPEITNKEGWTRVDRFPDKQLPQEEGISDIVTRNVTRAGTGALSSVLGAPKDIYSFIQSVTPESVKGYLKEGIQANPITSVPFSLFSSAAELAPGSEDIKKGIQQGGEAIGAPQGFFEPKSENEALFDTITSDIATLMTPVGPLGGVAPLKALKISGASNLASFLTKKVGGGPLAQEGVKIGTALLTSMGQGASLKKQAQDTYTAIKESPISKKTMRIGPIRKITKDIEKDFLKMGRTTDVPEKELIKNIIGDFNTKIKNGRIKISDVAQFKKDLSKDIQNLSRDKTAQQKVIDLQSNINKLLKDQGYNKLADQFIKADELWTGASRAQQINDFAKSVITDKFPNVVAIFAALGKPGTFIPKLGQLGAAGGASFVAGHVINNIKNILTLPTLRKDYASLLGAAAKENAPLVLKKAEKFEKELIKLTNNQPKQSREITDKTGWKRV